jgi:hypothetical protein
MAGGGEFAGEVGPWEQRWSMELLEPVRLVKHNLFQIMLI